MKLSTSTVLRSVGQGALGAMLVSAGVGHLTKLRREFQAQVPSWVPIDPDRVVVASGFVEVALGAALLSTWRQPARQRLGNVVATFFVAVFPGNIAQYTGRRDGFGLDTDRKRAARLLGQPVLVAWAWAATRDRADQRAASHSR